MIVNLTERIALPTVDYLHRGPVAVTVAILGDLQQQLLQSSKRRSFVCVVGYNPRNVLVNSTIGGRVNASHGQSI